MLKSLHHRFLGVPLPSHVCNLLSQRELQATALLSLLLASFALIPAHSLAQIPETDSIQQQRQQQPDTSFTYRGQLLRLGEPVTDLVDFELTLWDAAETGNRIGQPQWIIGHYVMDGLFSLTLDFGPEAFSGAEPRWLEIAVLSSTDTEPVTLTPRQRIAATLPVALYALKSPVAETRSEAEGGGAIGARSDSGDQGTSGAPGGKGRDGLDGDGVTGRVGDDQQQNPQGSWVSNGNDIYYIAGNVGIGTSTPANPLQAENASPNGTAIVGWARSGGSNLGVYGLANGGSGTGVFGLAKSPSDSASFGGRFESRSSIGRGVYAIASSNGSGQSFGGWFQSNSSKGRGIQGYVSSATGKTYGGLFQSNSSTGYGLYSYAAADSGTNYALYSKTNSSDGYAGFFVGGRNYFQGKVGIGISNPTAPLHTTGAVTFASGWRLEPVTQSPNIIGGHSTNSAAQNVYGATIAGGGTQGAANQVSASYATVSGGWGNHASHGSSTISGGAANDAAEAFATVSGGHTNQATAQYATISGGRFNDASDTYATVSGGSANEASNDYATVSGGDSNHAVGQYSSVSGGSGNWGIGLGSTVSGGLSNSINAGGSSATISGGYDNTATNSYCTVSGGSTNSATAESATVSGGDSNSASGASAAIGGGAYNSAGGVLNTIAGGSGNTTLNAYSTIGGGASNTAIGVSATIPGGFTCQASGSYTFASGTRAQALHNGAFVWGDSTNADVASTAIDQWTARAKGGVRFYTDAGLTTGVEVAAGGSGWSAVSDRNRKENFEVLDPRDVLSKVCAIPMTTWNYKTQNDSIRHMGPMAQDFWGAFGLGADELRINSIDADGVALAAIQGLNEIVKEKDAEIEDLKQRLARLEAVVAALAAADSE
ncbi:MAG: hypothetical protein D8M59_03945 [Planctomycetes bacterium]|nr:hypothetical protein [Planctomycetota bacterium]NOG55660.1 hypothetical protein [Planctomycetota bacterium]